MCLVIVLDRVVVVDADVVAVAVVWLFGVADDDVAVAADVIAVDTAFTADVTDATNAPAAAAADDLSMALLRKRESGIWERR